MEYKYKTGDKVRIKAGVDLERICIVNRAEEVMSKEYIIADDTPGGEIWYDTELDGTPTYTLDYGWRMPEAFLELI